MTQKETNIYFLNKQFQFSCNSVHRETDLKWSPESKYKNVFKCTLPRTRPPLAKNTFSSKTEKATEAESSSSSSSVVTLCFLPIALRLLKPPAPPLFSRREARRPRAPLPVWLRWQRWRRQRRKCPPLLLLLQSLWRRWAGDRRAPCWVTAWRPDTTTSEDKRQQVKRLKLWLGIEIVSVSLTDSSVTYVFIIFKTGGMEVLWEKTQTHQHRSNSKTLQTYYSTLERHWTAIFLRPVLPWGDTSINTTVKNLVILIGTSEFLNLKLKPELTEKQCPSARGWFQTSLTFCLILGTNLTPDWASEFNRVQTRFITVKNILNDLRGLKHKIPTPETNWRVYRSNGAVIID